MTRLATSTRLVLTERDTELLASLAEYRHLTVSQLERLHFASSQTARRRLRLLAQAGLVRLAKADGVPDRVVSLTASGAGECGARSEAPGASPSPLFLRHHLAAAEFRLRLSTSCSQRSEIRLVGYLAEHLMRAREGGVAKKYIRDEVPLPRVNPRSRIYPMASSLWSAQGSRRCSS